MSIGFRPTQEDNDIIQAHKRPDESTSDVLRRALRALDRDRWEKQAREDMERIAASGEDLSGEPDAWGIDEDGAVVDHPGSDGDDVAVDAPVFFGHTPEKGWTPPHGDHWAVESLHASLVPSPLRLDSAVTTAGFTTIMAKVLEPLAIPTWVSSKVVPSGFSGAALMCGPALIGVMTAKDFTDRTDKLLGELADDLAPPSQHSDEQPRPVPPKLARLRATARRASKR